MALPAAGYISDAARTEGEQKTAFEDMRDAIAQAPGSGVAIQQLTISTGTITPAVGASQVIDVRGQGGADDQLDNIAVTNVAAGAFVYLFPGNPGTEDITVADAAGGSGQILLADSANFLMDQSEMTLVLRLLGTDWIEVGRFWGDQTTQTAPFRTFFGFGDVVTLSAGTGASDLPQASDHYGIEEVWIGASAMFPSVTNGCAVLTVRESGSSNSEYEYLAFDWLAVEEANFQLVFPKRWNAGTLTFTPYWSHDGSQTGGLDGVVWGFQGQAVESGGDLTSLFGTQVLSTAPFDADGVTADRLTIAGVSTAHTLAGGPAKSEIVLIQVTREVGDGSDDMDIDAWLVGVLVRWTADALNDA